MTHPIFLTTAQATRSLGVVLGQALPPGSTLLLEGELGSGKTTLVQGLGEGLGITEPIVSPTFTLISEYLDGRLPLYHLDLYRLQPEEVVALNVETYWDGMEVAPGIVVIEWAQRLPYTPHCYLRIRLDYSVDHGRQAVLLPIGGFDLSPLSFLPLGER